MKCWQCQEAAEGLVCGACGALLPPDPLADHFSLLGLERRFAQEPADIAKRHRALQRQVHPDRFAHHGPRERRLAMEHATNLNDAVRTLKDPRRRADYLLRLRGVDLDDEGEGRVQLDPEFLMEVIEVREAIAELDGPDGHTERARLARDVVARYEATLTALGEGLDAEPPAPTGDLAQRAAQLRYLRRILDELERMDDA